MARPYRETPEYIKIPRCTQVYESSSGAGATSTKHRVATRLLGGALTEQGQCTRLDFDPCTERPDLIEILWSALMARLTLADVVRKRSGIRLRSRPARSRPPWVSCRSLS